ncbi:MAG: apolipoprotein N-acyltransferase [Halobacteriales archaeon]|jgi:apolipoprotein N-acyltransferase
MGFRWNLLLGGFVAVIVLGSLLAAFSLLQSQTGRMALVIFLGIILTIGVVAGGFVWWVRHEMGSTVSSEEIQERVDRRMNEDDQ